MAEEYANKVVLVIGLGVSGRSAARFLLERGARVVGVDRNEKLLVHDLEVAALRMYGLQTYRDSAPLNIDLFSLVVVSPGISPQHRLCQEASERGIETIGEIELACRNIKQPFLGITGTNGKTTVTLLVTHILNEAGKPARALGNYGVPLTSELLEDREEIIVCELSSFQLETMESRVIDAAVILNITPNHLDRHSSMEQYAAAKVKIHRCLKPDGILFVEEKACHRYASFFNGYEPYTYGYHPSCDLYVHENSIVSKEKIELFLPNDYRGKSNHDVENIMAAFALCRQAGMTPEEFCKGLRTFKKPPHRIEFVQTINGVRYYDDSKGTTVDAVMRAVETMEGDVLLIAGGLAKGASFDPWIEAFGEKVKRIFAIGEAKGQLEQELSGAIAVDRCETLESAVEKAFAIAREGENVLLSPGCASLDMFKNYEARGDRFKEIVRELERTGANRS